MIVSASRRTDIPAFHANWFKENWNQGIFAVPQMKNQKHLPKEIRTQDIDCVVYWTKDPSPLLRLGFPNVPSVCQFTITSYGKAIEPGVPRKAGIIETFKTVSRLFGKEQMYWRYDPVFFTPEITFDYHVTWHRWLCEQLQGYTTKCVFSFISVYGKLQEQLDKQGIVRPEDGVQIALVTELLKNASDYGMSLHSCCDLIDFTNLGVIKSHCIDGGLISGITGKQFDKKDPSQRRACGCVESIDIGRYRTCSHGCTYCYAS